MRALHLTGTVPAGAILAALGALASFALALFEPTHLNLFWQIPDGVAIAHGHFPQRVATAIESGPIVAHEWLFELVAGFLTSHGMFVVFVLLCALAAAANPLLVYALARANRCRSLPAGIAALLAAGARLVASAGRPETFAVDCFALELLVVAGVLRPWWTIAIVALWANVHASVALAVLAPLVLELAAAASYGRRDRRASRLLAIAVLALAATFLNPYGPRLWIYIIQLAIAPSPVTAALPAWQPLTFSSIGAWYAVLPGLAIFVLFGGVIRRRTIGEVVLAALLFVATLVHERYAVFLVVAWAVPLARTLDERTPLGVFSQRAARWSSLALVVPVVVALALIPSAHRTPDGGGSWVTAAAIAQAHHLHGNAYVEDAWAAYLTYRGLPLRMLIDGHGDAYPPAVWRDAIALQTLGPSWRDVLARRIIRVVIVPDDAPLANALVIDPAWVAIERRAGVAAFARRPLPLR